MEIVTPPNSLLAELPDGQIGDLSKLTEAAAAAKTSNARRRSGESLTSWGSRLKGRDKQIAKSAEDRKKKTRSGGDADFERKHPRSRNGSWTFSAGSSGDEVKGIQRRIGGTKVDGQFGDKTKAAVRAYQKRHGLKVDGIVGAQTIASLRGKKGIKPGAASASDRRWLVARAKAGRR